MKALPCIASKDMHQPTYHQLHENLWHSYVKDDPDVLRRNFIGAIGTYADLLHSKEARDHLPSAMQFQKLWQRITTKEQPEVRHPTPIAPIIASDPFLNLYATQPKQTEEGRTAHRNTLAKWKVVDKAALAKACLDLARQCSNAHPLDEKLGGDTIHQIVQDIWTACHEDVLQLSSRKPSSAPVETVHHMRMTIALLEVADPEFPNNPLVSITDEQRKTLQENGLKGIKVLAAKLKEEQLTKNLFFTSPEAKHAIGYFLQRLVDANPPESKEECKFAEKYLKLCLSRGHEAFGYVQQLDRAMARWRNTPRKSD